MADQGHQINAAQAELLNRYQLFLTGEEQSEDDAQETLAAAVKFYSLLIGGSCGALLQLSTLGANFLLVSRWGNDHISTGYTKGAMVLSLSWSFFTSCIALLILVLLRRLISTLMDANSGSTSYPQRDILLINMEVCFIIGALTGVCVAWTCTDFLFGRPSLAFYSSATLAFSFFWSRGMIRWFSPRVGNEMSVEQKTTYSVDRALVV